MFRVIGSWLEIIPMVDDWIYAPDRLEFRGKVLNLLLRRFGTQPIPTNNKQIYECAHDWVSQGNQTTSGLISYYKAYYDNNNYST